MTKLRSKFLQLSQNKIGATLIEMMGMIVVLALSLLTMFTVLTQGIYFSYDTEARVRAINLAREGIEAVINIRNTNWLRFTSDRDKCWDTLNYNASCIGSNRATYTDFIEDGSYILTRENGVWKLSATGAWDDTAWEASFDRYRLHVDATGWYTSTPQSPLPCNSVDPNNLRECSSMFARDIIIRDKTASGFTVESRVHWYNNAQREVVLETQVFNWKSRLK